MAVFGTVHGDDWGVGWVADGAEVVAGCGGDGGVCGGEAVVAHVLKVYPVGDVVVAAAGEALSPCVGADGDGLGLQGGGFPRWWDFGGEDAGDVFFEGDGVDLVGWDVAAGVLRVVADADGGWVVCCGLVGGV